MDKSKLQQYVFQVFHNYVLTQFSGEYSFREDHVFNMTLQITSQKIMKELNHDILGAI